MNLEDHLAGLGASPVVADLLRDLGRARSVRTESQQGYVSVSPSPIGAIALFAHRHRLEVALRPELANAALLDVPGAELKLVTPATTRLVVCEETCRRSREQVLQHAVRAVDWRAGGPAWTAASTRRATVAPGSARPACPTCWVEFTPSGACHC